MKAHLYKLTCLTNMHVGNGDANYDIIDEQVERDPITDMPTIFSSGVKGALREHFEQMAKFEKNPQKKTMLEKMIVSCFGDKQEGTKASTPGNYKFLNANMIARPLRVSKGDGAYVLTGVSECLKDYLELLDSLGIKAFRNNSIPFIPQKVGNNKTIKTNKSNIELEGYATEAVNGNPVMEKLVGKTWAVTNCETMKEFLLPVQARNVLDENGLSQNLWYEEVVPHKTIFHVIVITPTAENLLDNYLKEDNIVQFGANASIGYGLCKMEKICQ